MRIIRLADAKAEDWPDHLEMTPEQLKEAYALARASFTADDLQQCTEIEGGVFMDTFLAELEQAEKDHAARKKSP